MNGYKEAEKADRIINKILEENPITKENANEWFLFQRVIRSGCDIILHELKRKERGE